MPHPFHSLCLYPTFLTLFSHSLFLSQTFLSLSSLNPILYFTLPPPFYFLFCCLLFYIFLTTCAPHFSLSLSLLYIFISLFISIHFFCSRSYHLIPSLSYSMCNNVRKYILHRYRVAGVTTNHKHPPGDITNARSSIRPVSVSGPVMYSNTFSLP